LTEAVSAGLELHPKIEKGSAPVVDSVAEPEGGSCSWTAGTVTPAPVLDEATAVVGNTLYSFAGVANGAIVANSFKFDGTTWTPIAPLPTALEFPTAVTDGTVIYILGGADSTGLARNLLYKYDPVANSYTPLATFTTGSWNTAAVYLNGKIYKFAGTTGPSASSASTNALEIYDVVGNTWSPGANYPLLNSFVSAFTQGGFIYGAGGIASVGSVVSAKTYRYDPVANSWDDAAIADLPATRWGAASSGVGYGSNNGWVLAGGYVAGAVTANISTSVIRWDPVGNTWATLTSMTGERSRMTGGILNSSFYVVGGRSVASPSFVGTNTNQKFTCISNVVIVNQGTVTITAEGCGTPNNAPDPGETLTVALPITNTGDIPSTNLTATLLATGGVTNPGPPQNYGAVPPGGGTVTKNFTFTVDPNTSCGGSITLTWTIADGATNYTNSTTTYTTGVLSATLSDNI
jgi:N-acetylneuraminic acid mutarotase